MNSNIDFDLYKIFYVVVKAGTFSKAAEELFVSQSAVTQSMQKLEDQLGGKLFIRSKKGVSLTDAGTALFDYITPSLETMESAEDVFAKYQKLDMGTIRIVSGSSLAKIILKDHVIDFCRDYPNIKISIERKRTSEAIKLLSTGNVDLVLLNLVENVEYDNIKTEELFEVQDVFFVNKEFYKKIKKDITLKNLNQYKLVFPASGTNTRIAIDDKLKDQEITIDANYSFTSFRMLADFVKKTETIGYATKEFIQEELDIGSLVELDLGLKNKKRKIGIAYLDKKIMSNATAKLMEYIKEK